MEKLVARQQSGNVTHTRTLPARLSNRAENSGPRTVCNRSAPYQALVEIQLEPFLTVLRTVRPDSGKVAYVTKDDNYKDKDTVIKFVLNIKE